MKYFRFVYILLLLVFAETTTAAPAVVFEDMQHEYLLGKHLDFIEDKEKTLTINDIISDKISRQWSASTMETPNFGFTHSAFWVRFTVINPAGHDSPFFLEIAYPYLDHIEVYVPNADNYLVKASGDHFPYDSREISHPHFVFPLQVPSGQTTYYLRVDSIIGDTVVLPITLWTPKGFTEKVNIEQTVPGIYYGSMLVMLIYYLFLFFSLRERVYIYIVWFIAGFILFQACEDGLATAHLWPDNFWLTNYAIFFICIFGPLSMMKFSQHFLDTSRQIPKMNQLINSLILIYVVCLFFLATVILIQPVLPVFIPMTLTVLVIVCAVLLLVCGILCVKNRFRPARYFLLAETGLLCGMILLALRITCILPIMFMTSYGAQIGSLIAVVFLSFGLADKINIIKNEREDYLNRIYALINSSTDLIFLKDTKFRYLVANKAHEDIFNIKVNKILGKTDFDIMPFQEAEHCRESDIQAMDEGYISIKESVGDRNYHVIKQKVMNGGNALVGVAAVIRDITEQRRAETDREQLSERLRQSQKMESIGTLAGGIAHDFNNILTAILGYTEISFDDVKKGTPLEDILKEVYKAGLRAKDLVQQILTFARQTEQELKPIRVSVIVKEVLKLMRSTFPSTIEIKKNIRSDAMVMADPMQIHQLIMNLCTNASHAMEEHGGTLEVNVTDEYLEPDFTSRHPDIEPGHHLKISVTDTGIGMHEEILESIFEPYFTTKEKGEGTGLGLSVVHGIIKRYGGEITVESKPGKGSTFSVYLPTMTSDVEEKSTELSEIATGNERILLVDDEPTITKMCAYMLGHLGYSITTRTNGLEALELFRHKPDAFDLVITDMTMPYLTGDQLAFEILKIRPGIPIILCTGYSKKISEAKAKNIGIKAFIMKPIIQRELANTIRRVLEK